MNDEPIWVLLGHNLADFTNIPRGVLTLHAASSTVGMEFLTKIGLLSGVQRIVHQFG
jgi:hypothetical protein